MILNHKEAIAFLVDRAEYVGFNRYTFLNLHQTLSEGLLGNHEDEGRLRTRTVGIGGSAFTPLAIPQQIEEIFDRILAKAAAIPDLLRDVFVWGYERSCEQYKIVHTTIVSPDQIRRRYRDQLIAVAHETVLQGQAPQREALRQWAHTNHVPDTDVEAFVARALSALLGLHEGQLYNYQLTSEEFTNWRSRFHAPQ